MASNEIFPDREGMRSALRAAVHEAWPNCVQAATAPNALIDLYADEQSRMQWCIQHESVSYQQHLNMLLPVDALFRMGFPVRILNISTIETSSSSIRYLGKVLQLLCSKLRNLTPNPCMSGKASTSVNFWHPREISSRIALTNDLGVPRYQHTVLFGLGGFAAALT